MHCIQRIAGRCRRPGSLDAGVRIDSAHPHRSTYCISCPCGLPEDAAGQPNAVTHTSFVFRRSIISHLSPSFGFSADLSDCPVRSSPPCGVDNLSIRSVSFVLSSFLIASVGSTRTQSVPQLACRQAAGEIRQARIRI